MVSENFESNETAWNSIAGKKEWVARCGDKTIMCDYNKGSQINTELLFNSLEKSEIRSFGWNIGNTVFEFMSNTGRFYVNGKESEAPNEFRQYFDQPINYAEGLICFINAYSEQNTSRGTITRNDFASFCFGWKNKIGNKKVQVVCRINPTGTHRFEISTTDLETQEKNVDLGCDVKVG